MALFCCCKVKHNQNLNDINNKIQTESSQDTDWIIDNKVNYKTETSVAINIRNNYNSELFIFDPLEKHIEKFNGEKWIKIQLNYCPCRGCPAPPDVRDIPANYNYEFYWDKTLTTCKNNRKQVTTLESGLYRVIINYSKTYPTKDYEKLILEFDI